ncbi:restriction endonuclease [Rhodanobacter denitrificans]|nr:restriction endonuclease [Rhodanobacter denitrificans]UJJ58619.1 restriction endonuclease [Rhodanobacter denitrificans]UJM87847.1 restriction endonuclease [Rhodanobacter denitrificans]
MTRKELTGLYLLDEPQAKPGTAISGASQVWRFINEIAVGDYVLTYSPSNRTYLLGKVTGPAQHRADWAVDSMALVRPVQWQPGEIDRDNLSVPAKNSLGSTLTVFLIPDMVATELVAAAAGKPVKNVPEEDAAAEDVVDPFADIETAAVERIKDLVSALDPREMEQLVAGILRAMGYKTQVSPVGADRGKDIIASPDGFGFQDPRIVVEVKHRSGQMGSQAIRSFLGGRHKDDRGLYVSTGGFSKDALYEADRAAVPLTLWTLDNLIRALIEHYDKTDAETKRLVPLKRMYWPA